ncbi:WD40 repeat [Trypanosoma melophagium]|uniref:WD40 repeat n=1 Tax=Trypanosoma melophagium TaxID=715481 RepID=UPI003519EA08|nr:WD40 repeat [Trypanosoma melophagium]
MEYTPQLRRYALADNMRMYHADLAYRMQPLLPLTSTMAYLNHTSYTCESSSRDVSCSHNSSSSSTFGDGGRFTSEGAVSVDNHDEQPSQRTHASLDSLLTYADMYISSFSINRELNGHTGCVNSLALNSSDELLLSGSDDLSFCLYDTYDWTLRNRYRTMHRSNIFAAVFIPGNERRVLSCALDGHTLLTDLERAEPFYKCRHMCMASSLATSSWWPETAYVAYSNGVIARVDTRLRSSHNQPPDVGNPCISEVTQVRALAVHDRWPFLIVSGTNTSRVYFHDVRMGFLGAFATISISSVPWSDGISGLAFSDAGDWLAVNYRRQDIYAVPWLDALYTPKREEIIQDDHNEGENSFERLLSMGKQSKLPDVNVQNTIRLRGRQNNQTMFKEVAFMENDNIICSGGDCGNVYFWRLRDGKLLHTTRGDSDIVNAVLYNNRTGSLISSGIDATIKVLESDGRLQKQELTQSEGGERSSGENVREGPDPSLILRYAADVTDAIASEIHLFSMFGLETEENSDRSFSSNRSDSDAEIETRRQRNEGIGSLKNVSDAYEKYACIQFKLVLKLRESTGVQDLRHFIRRMRMLLDMANRGNFGIDTMTDWTTPTPAEELSEREVSNSNEENNSVIANDSVFLVDHEYSSTSDTPLSDNSDEEYNGNDDDYDDIFLFLEESENVRGEEQLPMAYLSGVGRMLGMRTINSDNSVPLFPMMCRAFNTVKRMLDIAFRQWIVPGIGQVQIPRWNRCNWGTAPHSLALVDNNWFNEYPDIDITDQSFLRRLGENVEASGGTNNDNDRGSIGETSTTSGHAKIISLIYIMDFLLQGKEYLCTTTKERRRYWMFRCVLELCYVYYYMAIGDTEMAIERANRLERHAEYRCVTALGSVNRAYVLRQQVWQQNQQKKRQEEEEPEEEMQTRSVSILELPRSLDSTCFPPLLVPLALQIRILVLSQRSKTTSSSVSTMSTVFPAVTELEEEEDDDEEESNTEEEERYREVQSERRISMLVAEMRNRLDGHPNRRVSRRVICMLNDLHIMV